MSGPWWLSRLVIQFRLWRKRFRIEDVQEILEIWARVLFIRRFGELLGAARSCQIGYHGW